MGLLSGLSGFGLGALSGKKLYEEPKAKTSAKDANSGEAAEAPQIQETDFLFEKTYQCPACEKEFKALTMKANRAKLKGTDQDLRPTYENVEPLKYDVVVCPNCGCAALSRYWNGLTSNQRKLIKEQISKNFKSKPQSSDTYSYEEAIERYQLALANAIVKQAKPSEKAYICLRAGWTLRSKVENLDPSAEDYAKVSEESKALEDEFLQNALEGFVAARGSESFPVCGMDETTMDYLIAALSFRFGKYDQASRLLSGVLTSRTIGPRMKDKALTLKEEIVKAKS